MRRIREIARDIVRARELLGVMQTYAPPGAMALKMFASCSAASCGCKCSIN